MRRPCSSHVYQVTDTPASRATSSRRRPGRAAAASGRKPDLLGTHGLTPGPQELGQLGAMVESRPHLHQSTTPAAA